MRVRQQVGQERRVCAICDAEREFAVVESWKPARVLGVIPTQGECRRRLICQVCGFSTLAE
jgi:coenzyme F420-reducing hydrogenase alpha subunit